MIAVPNIGMYYLESMYNTEAPFMLYEEYLNMKCI